MDIYDAPENIELLVDGREAFQRIIERIRSASESIYINMFIWRDDKIGNIIAQEIIDAADRGVKVHITKDKLGEVFEKSEEKRQSFFHKKFNPDLLLAETALYIMYPMTGKAKSSRQAPNILADRLIEHANVSIERENIRGDHSKYYIFDNKILILGGINIEDKAIYTDVEGKKYNDYMIEMKDDILVKKFISRLYDVHPFDEESSIEFIFNIKDGEKAHYNAKDRILELLSSAKAEIDIVMAYIGDKDITEKIIESTRRGILVNILLPGKANVQHDFNMKTLRYIMEKTDNKVNAYLSKNMVHAKLIRIDRNIVTFGSTNLNKQAMQKLAELNVLVKDYDGFIKSVDRGIKKNISNAKRIMHASEIKYNPIKALLEQMV